MKNDPKNSNHKENANQKGKTTSAERSDGSDNKIDKANESNWFVPDYLKNQLLKKPVKGQSKTVEPKLNHDRKHAYYPLVFTSDTHDLKEADIREASKDWPFYQSPEGKISELEIIQIENSHTKKFYVNAHCYENPKMNPKWHPANCRVETFTGINKPKKYTEKKANSTLVFIIYMNT